MFTKTTNFFFARTFVCEFFQYGFTVLEVVQNIYSFDTNPDLYQDIHTNL